MADTTPQKRVLPARERRESAVKRLASSPIVQPSSTLKSAPAPSSEPRVKRKYTKRASLAKPLATTSTASTPTTATEEVLPTKITGSKPLPVLREKQSEDVSIREYQTIADSAILSASLHRSRMQWLCEGVFKRYWSKPVKRKGVVEQPPGNPDIKSMQKLGNATITIEPHTFDATFYTVREAITLSPPVYRHPNQHTVKHPQLSQPLQPPPSPQPPQRQPMPPPPAVLTPPIPPVSSVTPPSQPIKQEEKQQENTAMAETSAPGSTSTPVVPPTRQPPVPPPGGPPKPSDDPVIQMLAARAASDPRLKELMKVVAMSQATADQLREFQSHIDEFNTIVKQQKKTEAEQKAKAAAATNPVASGPAPPSSQGTVPIRAPTVHGMGGPVHVTPSYTAYPPPPPPRPEAIIKHIVVEFHSSVSSTQSATTDRWLFPEHAVLEMRPGGMEIIASFFVERSGEEVLKTLGEVEDGDVASRQKYEVGHGYYQPVTMLIKATQHRTIETIARAAKPLVEVQTYMKEVLEKKTRAPQEYLVHRLPRDKVLADGHTGEFIDSGVEVSDAEDDELKDHYGIH